MHTHVCSSSQRPPIPVLLPAQLQPWGKGHHMSRNSIELGLTLRPPRARTLPWGPRTPYCGPQGVGQGMGQGGR